MRGGLAAVLAVATVALAGCGGSSHAQARPSGLPASIPGTQVATTAGGGSGSAGNGSGGDRSGGEVGGSRPTAHRSSPPQLIAAADAICRSYRSEVKTAGHATNLASQEHVYAEVVGDARAAVAKLHALTPPPSQSTQFGRYIGETSSAIDDFAAAQSRSRSTQERTNVASERDDFAAFQRAAHASGAAHASARALGLRVCGSPGSDWL